MTPRMSVTAEHTTSSPRAKKWLRAAVLTTVAAVTLSGTVPAYAATTAPEQPVYLHVEGTVVVLQHEGTVTNGDAGLDVQVWTDENTVIPVTGAAISDAVTGSTVELTVKVPARILDEADVTISGTVDADSAAGQKIAEAAADAPLAVAATGSITPPVSATPTVAGMPPAFAHTMDIAVITDSNGAVAPGTDAFIRGLVTKTAEFYNDQASGVIPTITVNNIIRYQTTASGGACSYNNVWTEAAAKYGHTSASWYYNGNSKNHLVVIAPPACGNDSGYGNVGSISLGGVMWAALGGTTDAPYSSLTTIAHEFGHNIGLMHSNTHECTYPAQDGKWTGGAYDNGCTDHEYQDMYDVMGGGSILNHPNGIMQGNPQVPALNVNSKDRLGVAPEGLIVPVVLPTGQQAATTSYTLNPASGTSGARGLKVTDPRSNEIYYFEYRNGTGRDNDTVYNYLAGFGTGLHILKTRASDSGSVNLPYWSGTVRKMVWPAGTAFTSRTGGVTVAVSGLGSQATLNVTVTGNPAFTGTAKPTITGTAMLGRTLTAVPGTDWSPAADSYTYSWNRDGSPIAGATGKTYLLAAADTGRKVDVTVTQVKTGFTSVVRTSEQVTVADVSNFTGTTPAVVSGTFAVGNTVEVAPGAGWEPAPDSYTYQWYRNNTAIAGATNRTYLLATADAGTSVYAIVTRAKADYRTMNNSSPATTVEAPPAQFTGNIASYYQGLPYASQILTATNPTWTPEPTSWTYQWTRDGVDISGETQKTFTTTVNDIGHSINVRQVGSKAGYASRETTTGVVQKIIDNHFAGDTLPTVTGTRAAGQKLTAVVPLTIKPTPGYFGFEWKRDGITIPGVTFTEYTQTGADVGHTITVSVTANLTGIISRTWNSADDSVTGAGTFTGSLTATVTGTRKVGSVLTSTVTNTLAPAATVTHQWTRDGAPIEGATAVTYTQVAGDEGHVIRYAVTAAAAGFASKTATAATDTKTTGNIGVVEGKNGAPTVTGTRLVGKVLTGTVTASAYTPAPTGFAYQWLRDGVAITGATAATYTQIAADSGHRVSLRLTVKNTLYVDTVFTSTDDGMTLAEFTGSTAPQVTGPRQLNSTLTGVKGTDWGTTGATLTYQWTRDGVAIADAHATTYLQKTADVGHTVGLKITATKTGYAARTWSSTGGTATIPLHTITGTMQATVTGTRQVGQKLTSKPGADWAITGATLAYQWTRNGDAITGATATTYTQVAADGGTAVAVKITASKAGYATRVFTQTTPPKTYSLFAVAGTPTVSITGTRQATKTLTAVLPNGITPTPIFAVQWTRNGVDISGGIGSTYVQKTSDIGAVINAKVYATKTSYMSKVWATNYATKTTAPTPMQSLGITITGVRAVGGTMVAAPNITQEPAQVLFQWLRDGVVIPGATSSSYTQVAADLGKKVNVRVTAVKPGYDTKVWASSSLTLTAAGTFTGGTFTVSGDAVVGAVQSARFTVTPTPASATITYRWRRDNTVITGQTAASYTVVAGDAGHRITAEATVRAAGYTERVFTDFRDIIETDAPA